MKLSLHLLGHLKLFEARRNILPQVLVVTLIILPEVEPRNQPSLEIQEIIKVLVLHLLSQRVDLLHT